MYCDDCSLCNGMCVSGCLLESVNRGYTHRGFLQSVQQLLNDMFVQFALRYMHVAILLKSMNIDN